MSATDELRRMLDERGAEYKEHGGVTNGTMEPYSRFVMHGDDGYVRAVIEADSRDEVMLTLRCSAEQAIEAALELPITGETSDGYHTFNELYHHRSVLFSVIVHDHRSIAWKSRRHHDGSMYDGMFIVGINTPWGQATYHYDIDPYWDTFDCAELDHAPEWDGHTPDEAIARIARLCEPDAEGVVE